MAPPGTFHHPIPALAILFLLSLVCASHPGDDANAGGSCIESERRALLAVRGDIANSSMLFSSWRGRDCCQWKEVGCDKLTGHVIKLDLRCTSNHIFYQAPSKVNPSLSQLTHLEYLDLSMNYFNDAPIPEFIGSLIHLSHLDLSSTGFNGMVPQQLGNLSSLHYLDLSWNSLNGSDLHWLSKLHSLSVLNLRGAFLGDSNLDTLSHVNFSTLTTLDLSENYFPSSTIPPWIFNISSITHLYLCFCMFSGGLPATIGNLYSLQWLDLSGNNISGDIPEIIGNLGQLKVLQLSSNLITGSIPETLTNLSQLELLDISMNSVSGEIPRTLESFVRLKHLDLSSNRISGDIPKAMKNIMNLTRLEHLDISMNAMSGEIPTNMGNLYKLRFLSLGYNNITVLIPWETLGNISRLQELHMGSINVRGPILETIGRLGNLEVLDLSNNSISGGLPRAMGKLCKLNQLNLSDNSIGGEITNFLDDLSKCSENRPSDYYGLSSLALGNNELNGTIPKSLGQMSHLHYLDLSHNSFVGVLTEAHFAQVIRLWSLDLSYNDLRMNVSEDWVLPSQLNSIQMCSCPLGPKFPSWLRNQRVLDTLCISEAGITENFPAWFWDASLIVIRYLNASHNDMKGRLPTLVTNVQVVFDVSSNHFQGTIPMFISPWMYLIDLSNNSFSGQIAFSYAINDELEILSLSYNYITGTIPDSFCNLTFTRVLKLSNNDLSGQLPNCWHSFSQLEVLDLSHNNFSGKIPNSMGNLTLLQSLHMRNNGLSGEIPSSWNNLSQLVTLDVGENKLSGTIPTWIGENLSSLRVLSLRSNLFHGNIPLKILHLTSLQVLDLAHNHLSGILPPSFGNFTAMVTVPKGEETMLTEPVYNAPSNSNTAHSLHHYYSENLLITAKGSQRDYTTVLSLVTSIDLSDNNLSGEIPEELTRLVGLRFLNLSANQFVGKIPENISQMLLLESLDLSINNLSGKIPNGIARLNFLSYLNLSSNNLSGRIPSGSQLQTFEPSAYSGNPNLCGPPLPNNCTNSSLHPGHQVEGNEDQSEILWVYLGLAPGLVVGFWGFIGAVMIKRTIRIAYFRLIDQMYDWLYVKVAVNFARIKFAIVKNKERQG